MTNTKKLGLIGFPLSHSFSKGYFENKFQNEGLIDYSYENFAIENIGMVKELLAEQNLLGLNITIPYKQSVIPFLDQLDETASEIGAVNTIKIKDGIKKGYNTDCYGFEMSFKPQLRTYHRQALILGTGGASKAIVYALKKLNIPYHYVSRQAREGIYAYTDITPQIIANYQIIINTTPLGMYPHADTCPPLPYEALTEKHYLFDLVYNPALTAFLKKGQEQGCTIKNGLDMLHFQAEKAWEIWNQ